MNKGISVKLVVINAMIAGVYAVLTLAISPIGNNCFFSIL